MDNAAIAIIKSECEYGVVMGTNLLKDKNIEKIELGILMLDAVKKRFEFELAKLKEFKVNK